MYTCNLSHLDKQNISNEEILLIIQSRSNPQGLSSTIKMCLETCTSQNNFKIVCFIDDDQVDLYASVREKFPQTFWVTSRHLQGDWSNTLREQLKFIRSSNCFFVWRFSDDVRGLNRGWDTHILDTKNSFKDEIFTSYCYKTRNPHLCSIGYNYSDDLCEVFCKIWHSAECLPIWTKRWSELILPLCIDTGYSSQIELFTAILVFLLQSRHGLTRIISCGASYDLIVDSGNSLKFLDRQNRTKCNSFFSFLSADSLKIFEPTIEKILTEISAIN